MSPELWAKAKLSSLKHFLSGIWSQQQQQQKLTNTEGETGEKSQGKYEGGGMEKEGGERGERKKKENTNAQREEGRLQSRGELGMILEIV